MQTDNRSPKSIAPHTPPKVLNRPARPQREKPKAYILALGAALVQAHVEGHRQGDSRLTMSLVDMLAIAFQTGFTECGVAYAHDGSVCIPPLELGASSFGEVLSEALSVACTAVETLLGLLDDSTPAFTRILDAVLRDLRADANNIQAFRARHVA